MTKRETSQFIIIIFQYIVILLLLIKYITQSRKKTVTTTIGNYASASLTNHNQLKTLGCTYTENGNCYDVIILYILLLNGRKIVGGSVRVLII